MTGGISHWDAVQARAFAKGELRGSRRRLGPAMGAERAGLSRYEAAPGERPMPLHTHADEEEILFVVRGSGITTDGERSWAIAAGDTVAHPAGGPPHTYVAGDGSLDVLVGGAGPPDNLEIDIEVGERFVRRAVIGAAHPNAKTPDGGYGGTAG